MSVAVASLDTEIAKKYQQLKILSDSQHILTFLVENKQSKEVCVLKCLNKLTYWQPDKHNKQLVNVRHNNLAKIIEIKETNEHYFVVEELCVTIPFAWPIF